LRQIRWKDGPIHSDQLIERSLLRFGQLHASMLGGGADIAG
jgi:hypothetical protein